MDQDRASKLRILDPARGGQEIQPVVPEVFEQDMLFGQAALLQIERVIGRYTIDLGASDWFATKENYRLRIDLVVNWRSNGYFLAWLNNK